jgi:hypothetical protein
MRIDDRFIRPLRDALSSLRISTYIVSPCRTSQRSSCWSAYLWTMTSLYSNQMSNRGSAIGAAWRMQAYQVADEIKSDCEATTLSSSGESNG